MTSLEHFKTIIDRVKIETNAINLFYSCGKDSIAMLDLCAPHFEKINCIFMYFVPELEHQQQFIRFATSKYNNISFIQVPHWCLSYVLRGGMFCTPREMSLLKLSDVVSNIEKKTGVNWHFLGMKQSDSLNRRLMLKGYDFESINPETNMVYPLSRWSKKEVIDYIHRKRLPKAIEYAIQNSNGLAFNAPAFLFLREKYPSDLEKIYTVFPLAQKILIDYDRNNQISK